MWKGVPGILTIQIQRSRLSSLQDGQQLSRTSSPFRRVVAPLADDPSLIVVGRDDGVPVETAVFRQARSIDTLSKLAKLTYQPPRSSNSVCHRFKQSFNSGNGHLSRARRQSAQTHWLNQVERPHRRYFSELPLSESSAQ
jgi:hypothetical protein